MPTNSSPTESGGFSAAERDLIRQRAAELRAEGKKSARKADGLRAVLEAITVMAPADRVLAERVHAAVSAHAPHLSAKTWYGMPAYTDADGKVVVCLKNAGTFKSRYATLEFPDAAHLDHSDLWPVSFAIKQWSPVMEQRIVELVEATVS